MYPANRPWGFLFPLGLFFFQEAFHRIPQLRQDQFFHWVRHMSFQASSITFPFPIVAVTCLPDLSDIRYFFGILASVILQTAFPPLRYPAEAVFFDSIPVGRSFLPGYLWSH